MRKHRRPAWWLLYALVPLLAGLCGVEHRAPLSPGWHTGVQVGMVLFIYGFVWLWLRANAFRLLWSEQGTGTAERAIEAYHAAIKSPGPCFTPRQAYAIDIRARQHTRRLNRQVKRRGMRNCSLSFDRQSS
jgi:hypothetical protein